jgi:hypothetical protein
MRKYTYETAVILIKSPTKYGAKVANISQILEEVKKAIYAAPNI